MLADPSECLKLLRCPRTKSELIKVTDERLISKVEENGRSNEYRIIDGKPILIDFSDSVFSDEALFESLAGSEIERKEYNGFKKSVKHLLSPKKKSTAGNVDNLISELQKFENPRVLVVGGGSIGQGMQPLYDDPRIQVIGFDVYASPHAQFVADAHHIPLPDNAFDAVVIQAVLEHVLQPAEVADEIWRVLRPGGFVYAETPFMQQVHEGPFDFTRFTESGHRYLFRKFELISSGASGGPGRQFAWAVDYLVRGLFRSVTAGKLAKLAFFWTQYLDRFIPAEYAQDGASGVFFYGRKSTSTVSPKQIIGHYKGAQR